MSMLIAAAPTSGPVSGRPEPSPSTEPVQPATPFVFASAGERLVARGSARTLRVQADTLATAVSRVRDERADDGDAPVLVGALPFDWRHDAWLIEPKLVMLTRQRASARSAHGRPLRSAAAGSE